MIYRAMISLSGAALLSGCGIAARVDARNEYRASTADYKTCLLQNQAAPQQCEALRLAMEADERKFNTFSAAAEPGAQRNSTITVLQR
jgi:hypothetical protein